MTSSTTPQDRAVEVIADFLNDLGVGEDWRNNLDLPSEELAQILFDAGLLSSVPLQEDGGEGEEVSSLRSEPSAVTQVACGVCGSEDIQYQPFSGGREYYCPACEDVHPYESGQAPRRAQMLQDGKFDELKQEMRDHLASLPKASGEAAREKP